ncbi:hypothetical protein ACIQ9J_01550 [Streptomyces sp. NPDC094153]|uniref:hypothetical protein n=1 Tax=Streptomyces sp. NPDC094153 TaxID=3366058 RepID=UPI003819C466
MAAQPSPGGDELRARAYLRALNARPFGHQESSMPESEKCTVSAGVRLPARSPEPDEIPPWRTPPGTLSKPEERPRDWLDDILDSDPTPVSVEPAKERRAPAGPEEESKKAEPVPDTEEEPEEGEPAAPTERQPPAWDPVAVADRIVRAYRDRPASERLRDAADVVVKSKARLGQLVFTASGVWAAWRIGMTPWLLQHTADAPIGIPVLVLGAGWLVNRRCDAGPLLIAWTGRAVYTATVINLVLHP